MEPAIIPMELVIIVAGAFAAAFAVGVSGFADALIASSIWLLVLAPQEAVPLIVATGVIMHSVSLARLRRFERARSVAFLLPGLVGVPVGVALLSQIDPARFKQALGVFLLAYVAYGLLAPSVSIPRWGGRAADAVVGLAGGVLGGLAGLSGVLPTLWCGLRGWAPDVQRGIYQPFILVMHILAVCGFALAGSLDREFLVRFGACLPVIFAGIWLGHLAYGRISPLAFRRLVLGLLGIAGISLWL